VVAQLKPDGHRSRMLTVDLEQARTRPCTGMQVPRTDVTVLDQRLPLRLAKRSPRRRELGRCRNSSVSTLWSRRDGVLAFVVEQKSCCWLVVIGRASDDVVMHMQVRAGDRHDIELRAYRFARRTGTRERCQPPCSRIVQRGSRG
jgi:hypothetical protein